ncbi:Ankyrin-related protein [Leptospira biflexa serovar Patoc strain 'Patoc 1 (Ames)']|uniref:Putative ankyrin-like protein n=1 Tax=Leptospira biflexa serovar Patoc (strain Patoc 1 / ATCC 23582 / Paris) TaxID=456481 RepID=B0SPM8_LEPBP|nr:ankyrin repeat domain-containing protein [Leptospira biflexa]ABZ95432.1 Ankyrin-related protein [Leptospira biflexa serovar Patoc strain 'Patoc 1 (Ames)']ABZ99134.1 Putative ankyrin-like protein [Leptospira biflexa serovar Patoc strain 'Patoc 1 (Paris)']
MNVSDRKSILNNTSIFIVISLFPLFTTGCIWTQTKSYYLKLTESKNLDKEVPKEKIKNLRIMDPRKFQNTPQWEMARAIYLCDYSRLQTLLSEKKVDLNVPNDAGVPLLSMAILLDREWAVLPLLEHGADPNFKSVLEPKSPMIYAARESPSILRLLLENGGDPNAKAIYDESLLDENHPPESALSVAAEAGHFKSVEMLVARGADVNFGHGRAVADSITQNHLNITLFLLKSGFNLGLTLYPLGFGGDLIQDRLQLKEKLRNAPNFQERDFNRIIAFLKEKGIEYKHVKPDKSP